MEDFAEGCPRGLSARAARYLTEITVLGLYGLLRYFAPHARPTRVSFAYYQSDAVVDYVIEAVRLIAALGARLLPDYRFDPRAGRWEHRDRPPALREHSRGRER